MTYKRVQITNLDSRGRGVCTLESGKKCFVENALPGELCDIEITFENNSRAEAKVTETAQKSAYRTGDIRPGASLSHLAYAKQLEFKQDRVRDCLTRIGKFDQKQTEETIRKIIPSPREKFYRNHMQYKISGDTIGQTAEDGQTILPIEDTFLEYEAIGQVAQETKKILKDSPVNIFSGLVVRGSERTQELMLEFVSDIPDRHEITIQKAKEWLKTTDFKNRIQRATPGNKTTGILLRISPDKISGRTRSGKRIVLDGNDFYNENFSGLDFKIEAGAFFQVNIEGAEAITSLIKEYTKDDENILDLFCGTGTLGLSILPPNATLTGVEISPRAIESAKYNANKNFPGRDIKFICRDASKVTLTQTPDTIIVDPPRKGLSDKAIKLIENFASQKLIYVSCDPATLARDLNTLKNTFTIEQVTPVDMFPQTPHVETVVLMSKSHKFKESNP